MTKAKLPAIRRPKLPSRKILVDQADFGPAMLALPLRQQKFAIAFWQCRDQTEAARQAGYAAHNRHSIKTIGCRLAHDPRVGLAITELGHSVLRTEGVKIAVNALLSVAGNAQHKDQVAAAKTILDRAGINTSTDHNINVKVTLTKEEKEAKLIEFAKKAGADVKDVLGVVDIDLDPSEYQEVDDAP